MLGYCVAQRFAMLEVHDKSLLTSPGQSCSGTLRGLLERLPLAAGYELCFPVQYAQELPIL